MLCSHEALYSQRSHFHSAGASTGNAVFHLPQVICPLLHRISWMIGRLCESLSTSAVVSTKQVVKMGGRELLWYQAPPAIHAALLRGTTADEDGNISCEDEACYADSLNQVGRPPLSSGSPSVWRETACSTEELLAGVESPCVIRCPDCSETQVCESAVRCRCA